MRTELVTQPAARTTSVEPSRAWILGLVVDADGSLSGPVSPEVEWPTAAGDGADARHDQIMALDAPARP